MVDVIKALGFEYVAAIRGPVSGAARSDHQLRRQQDAGAVTCCHEEKSSIAMAHGYAKIEGKPSSRCPRTSASARVDGDLQRVRGSRAGFRIAETGGTRAYGQRRQLVTTAHRTWRNGARLREMDDDPRRSAQFAESAVRAYKIAMTPPAEPVLAVIDHNCS